MSSFRNVFLLAVIKHIATTQKNQRKTHTHTQKGKNGFKVNTLLKMRQKKN